MKKSILLLTISAFFFLSNPSYTQSPDWVWARTAGESAAAALHTIAAYSIGVDLSGNSYVTGQFSETIYFGPDTLTATGGEAMFLVKYDAGGNVVWARSSGGPAVASAVSLAVDHIGNVYIAGLYGNSYVIFGSDTLWNDGLAVFVAKYDAGGNVLWARGGGGYALAETQSIAVDSTGNAYVTGGFSSSILTFGSYVLSNAGGSDVFLVKYDTGGNVLWAKSEGGAANEKGYSVMTDNAGDPCITGYFMSDTLIVGSDTLKNAGPGSMVTLLVKYDASGNVIWAKSTGINDLQRGLAVAGDASGNIYVAGIFGGSSITFGSTTLSNTSDLYDIFLVKYDASGDVLWAKSAGGLLSEYAGSLALDASGNLYITGDYDSSFFIIGNDTLVNTGLTDIFLAKYDAGGTLLWVKSAIGGRDDYSKSVAVDRSGYIYIAGSFGSWDLIFGSDTLTRRGGGGVLTSDMFLAKANTSVGFPELRNSAGILVFPNPATDKITIEIAEGQALNQLSVFNLNGEEILTRSLTKPKTQIDISNLPGGIYFIRLINAKTVAVGKIIKE